MSPSSPSLYNSGPENRNPCVFQRWWEIPLPSSLLLSGCSSQVSQPGFKELLPETTLGLGGEQGIRHGPWSWGASNLMGRANSEKNVTIQVVSSMVEVAQSIIGAGAVFTESRRPWGNLPEDTASKAELWPSSRTNTSCGKSARPPASLSTSLEPQFFSSKKWEGQET